MRITLTTLAIPLVLSLASRTARADIVTDWNEATVQAIRTAKLGPNPATRALAIVHLSVHDAVNAVRHEHRGYATSPIGVVDPASPEAAAIAAAHRALAELFPAQKATFDLALANGLSAIAEGPAKAHGVDAGTAAAGSILAVRANDGATTLSGTFPGSTNPGKWRPTPPKFANADAPWWRQVRPFVLVSAEQFRAPAPPALASTDFTNALAEVDELGRATSTTRTAEQTDIARFWAQATHVPFNEIARKVATQKALPLADSARLFALLNLALADSRIAAWDSKYTHGFWRPISALGGGDPPVDGGTVTADAGGDAGDAGTPWTSLLETPNHPEYVSGHSATGAAGATLLKLYFGADAASFTVSSDTLPEVTRPFASFSAASEENGRSRIYGGIHYQFSNAAGQTLGAAVAQYVFDHALEESGAQDAGPAPVDASTPPPTTTPTPTDASVADSGSGSPPAEDSSCSVAFPGAASGAVFAWAAGLSLALVGTRRRRRR